MSQLFFFFFSYVPQYPKGTLVWQTCLQISCTECIGFFFQVTVDSRSMTGNFYKNYLRKSIMIILQNRSPSWLSVVLRTGSYQHGTTSTRLFDANIFNTSSLYFPKTMCVFVIEYQWHLNDLFLRCISGTLHIPMSTTQVSNMSNSV